MGLFFDCTATTHAITRNSRRVDLSKHTGNRRFPSRDFRARKSFGGVTEFDQVWERLAAGRR